jgi:hypothetical protein
VDSGQSSVARRRPCSISCNIISLGQGCPCRHVQAALYEYILAGNGVFVRGARREFQAQFCIAHCAIRGLADLETSLQLNAPRVPHQIVVEMIRQARAARDAAGRPCEIVFHLELDAVGTWQCHVPLSKSIAGVRQTLRRFTVVVVRARVHRSPLARGHARVVFRRAMIKMSKGSVSTRCWGALPRVPSSVCASEYTAITATSPRCGFLSCRLELVRWFVSSRKTKDERRRTKDVRHPSLVIRRPSSVIRHSSSVRTMQRFNDATRQQPWEIENRHRKDLTSHIWTPSPLKIAIPAHPHAP